MMNNDDAVELQLIAKQVLKESARVSQLPKL